MQRLAPEPLRVVLNWGRRYSLWVFNFGLACCAIEFIATSMARHDFIRLGVIPFAPGPRQADLMIVSGTVTDKMAPAVKRLYEQMPEPKYVISFGACSNSGGPYWDSYCVTKGVDQIIPVDVYVPGCPPRPEALLQGILKLQEKIAAEDLGERYRAASAAGAAPADGHRPRRAAPSAGPRAGRDRDVTAEASAAVAGALADELGGTASEGFGPWTVDVAAGRWVEALAVARDRLGLRFFDWLSAVDELGDGFSVVVPPRRPATARARAACAPGCRADAPVLATATGGLPRRGLARARDVRDVRHRLRRAPGPAAAAAARRLRGTPAAQGLRARRAGRQGRGRAPRSRGSPSATARRAGPAADAAARRARPRRAWGPRAGRRPPP